jgi:hypothetical protein
MLRVVDAEVMDVEVMDVEGAQHGADGSNRVEVKSEVRTWATRM